jgi:uncharacterized small protein (DUF1192 family)
MLMLHDPKECRNWGTPEYQFYEFNDRKILIVMGTDCIPRHLGNFVRDYIERNATEEDMKIIEHGDYTETDHMIRNALRAYSSMDPSERIKLHKKELNRMKREFEREKKWSVY